jgi:hypothetical protein
LPRKNALGTLKGISLVTEEKGQVKEVKKVKKKEKHAITAKDSQRKRVPDPLRR